MLSHRTVLSWAETQCLPDRRRCHHRLLGAGRSGDLVPAVLGRYLGPFVQEVLLARIVEDPVAPAVALLQDAHRGVLEVLLL